jgi:N-acetylglucosaminyldiphosphoundecaprenol N-acetyl-beta-D-mannosaminyltransferase
MRNPVAILGVPIDDLTTQQVLGRIEEFVHSRRFHQIATANTDFLIQSLEDPELKAILWTSDMVVPDGMPIVLASRWLGSPLKERVTGADLVPMLATRSAEKGYKIFMLGGKLENAEAARDRMIRENPGLQIVGCLSPPPSHIITMDNEMILGEIEKAAPDILFVAFGNPKQEKWIQMHRDRLQVPVCIGVGGTFDFLAGATARAPEWMQRSGLEWLHRLCSEPKRLWRRYARDLVHFSRLIILQLWLMRRRPVQKAGFVVASFGDCTILSLTGSLDRSVVQSFQRKANEALDQGSHLILDLQATTDIDSAMLGTLLNLPKRAAFVDKEIRLVGVSNHVNNLLKAAQAENYLRVYDTVAAALQGHSEGCLEVNLDHQENRGVLSLQGFADAESLAYLETKLRQIPACLTQLTIDLRNITFMETTILALLHRFVEAQKKAGVSVQLRTGEVVKRLLVREKLTNAFSYEA